MFPGLPASVSLGNLVAALLESHLRTGTVATTRDITARARLAFLPAPHPVRRCAAATSRSIGAQTWLSDFRQVMLTIGITTEIKDLLPGLSFATCECFVREQALQRYKRSVVLPRLPSLGD